MGFDQNHEIHLETLTLDYPHLKTVESIFEEAFPSTEKIEFQPMIEASEAGICESFAVVDGEVPVGLIVLVPIDETYTYLLYLAVDAQYRGMRYGSKVSKILQEQFSQGKVAFGSIEALEPEAENYEQRVARAKFYSKNGFRIYDEIVDAGTMGHAQFVSLNHEATFEELREKMAAIIKLAHSYEK